MTIQTLERRIQILLNDKAEQNRLIGKVLEFNYEDIRNATDMALDDINYTEPLVTSYTLENIPNNAVQILVLGVAKILLFGKIAEKSRNAINVNDGGALLNREGNISYYQQLLSIVTQEYLEKLSSHKANINILAGFGNVD